MLQLTNPVMVIGSLFLMLLNSCGGKSHISEQRKLFETIPDTPVVFAGMSDCSNHTQINMVLRLFADSTWQGEMICEKSSEGIQYAKGSFMIKNHFLTLLTSDSSNIPETFRIIADSLVPAGNERYVLHRYSDKLLERQWNLVELKGKNIPYSSDAERKPHFMLKLIGHRITGNGGCNGFGGSYELTGESKIRITKLFSTKMACLETDFENDFFEALQKADRYSIDGHTLTLMSGDHSLAKLTIGIK